MRKEPEKKNKKMKKGKIIFSTIAIMFILLVSIVNAEQETEEKLNYDRAKGELTYGNEVVVDFSNEQYDASEGILTTLKNPKGFKMEGNILVFTAENYNKEFDGKRIVISYDGEITFNKDGEMIAQKYKEEINLFADKSTLRITEIDKNENIKVTFETLDDDGNKEPFDLTEEQMKLYEFLPTGIPLNKYIKSEEETENSVFVTDSDGIKHKIIESEKASFEEVEKTEEEITEVNMVVPPGFGDEVASVLNSEEGGFSNPEFKDNTLTYNTKYNGVPIDVIVVCKAVYNKDGTIESITKKTTKKYDNNIIYFEKGDKKLEINQELGIKTIDYEEVDYIATVADGSQGKLTEDGTKFTYDIEEGSNVEHTLQSLAGGGTLEFHNKNTDEGTDGTITITRGNENIKVYGTFDENEMIVKDGKTILAKVLDNGNLLTDFDKNGENPQTTYYAFGSFEYGGYVFGRKQTDGSEKIYSAGYIPFAFKSGENIIIIDKQKDGSYKYFLNGNEVSEDNSQVKEAKAMVTKSKIGPAFSEAVRAVRGGIALSNLLNSWLDIDFITNWRKKTDEFFSETVIGRIISGKWEESVCHSKIEKIPENIAVVNVNNIMGFAAHVEGERSAAITTNNETLYLYKITFGVNPYGMGNITFELLIDKNVVDLDNDGMADRIELEADETYSGTGEKAVVRHKPEIYEEVCLKFYNTENLNAEFRNSLKDNKLCNKINEVDLSSVEISEPANSTAVSSTSTGQQGW